MCGVVWRIQVDEREVSTYVYSSESQVRQGGKEEGGGGGRERERRGRGKGEGGEVRRLTSTDEERVGHEGLEEVHLLQGLLCLKLTQLKLNRLKPARQDLI